MPPSRPASLGRTFICSAHRKDWPRSFVALSTLPGSAKPCSLHRPPSRRPSAIPKVKRFTFVCATRPAGFRRDRPLNLVYVAHGERMKDVSLEERRLYASVETSFIGQNVYLFCASEGLATVFRGAVDTAQARQNHAACTDHLRADRRLSPKLRDLHLYVRFSNRPVWVKRFQTIHRSGVDVARGLVLLFGIGTRALPSWGSRTRRNNLLVGLAVR